LAQSLVSCCLGESAVIVVGGLEESEFGEVVELVEGVIKLAEEVEDELGVEGGLDFEMSGDSGEELELSVEGLTVIVMKTVVVGLRVRIVGRTAILLL